MAISDAQYLAWLASDNVQRCVLVEADAYTGTGVDTFYMSNLAYVSGPTQTPANIAYDDVLVEVPEFTTTIDGDQSIGALEIVNVGDMDDWLTFSWSGHPLLLYFGDPSWDRDDFRLILDGICGGIDAPQRDALTLTLRDKRALLDVPVQTNLLADNQPIPICLGDVVNAEPILINAGSLIYQVHDGANFGALTSVNAVRDNGVALSTPAGYSVNLSAGTVTLVSTPAGRVTIDATGPDTTTADQCYTLVNLATPDIDTYNLDAYPNTATVGQYITGSITITQALNRLLRSSGGTYRFDRNGNFQIFQLDLPTGTADVELTADDIRQFGIEVARYEKPMARIQLGYQHNWTVQSADELAGSVSAANRKLYSEPWILVVSDNALSTGTLDVSAPASGTSDIIDSMFSSASDAQAEADRIALIREEKRFVYALDGFAAPLSLNIGQIVNLTHPRFGFAAGMKAVIIGLIESPTTGRVRLEVWA